MSFTSKTSAILRRGASVESLPPDETDRPDPRPLARSRRHASIWRGFACFALGLTLGATCVILAAPPEETVTIAGLSEPGR